jgi:AAA domain
MQLGKAGVMKSSERQTIDNVVINGVAYQRRRAGEQGQNSWHRLDQGRSVKLMPVTQRWIDRKVEKTANADLQIMARFARLKPEAIFDSSNLTWKNAPRFNPENIDDMEWLINLFIADRSINLIYAPEGFFKSTLMLYASKCIAGGLDFLDTKTLQRRVLYLDYENPSHVIKTRSENLQLNLPHNKSLIIWDRFGKHAPPHPRDPMLRNFVKECVRETGIGPVIVFDSWSSLMKPGEGGESTGQTAPTYIFLRKLADLGATIVIIDHSLKYEPDVIYGSADKRAKSDTIHYLEVMENTVSPENPIVTVVSTLKRNTPKGYGGFSFKTLGDAEHITGLQRVSDPKVEAHHLKMGKLQEIIRQHPGSFTKQVLKMAKQEHFARDEADRLLKQGEEKYWKVETKDHGRRHYYPMDSQSSLEHRP